MPPLTCGLRCEERRRIREKKNRKSSNCNEEMELSAWEPVDKEYAHSPSHHHLRDGPALEYSETRIGPSGVVKGPCGPLRSSKAFLDLRYEVVMIRTHSFMVQKCVLR